MASESSFVTVATFASVGEAEVARMMLEGHGVTCFLDGAELVNMVWLASNAVGGVKLQVAADQAAKAEQLLARRQRAHAVDDYGLATPQRPAHPAEPEDETEVEPDEPTSADSADFLVQRAWRAALLGLVLCPPLLHLWSLLLLAEAATRETPVSGTHRGKMMGALAIDLAVLFLGAVLYVIWTLSVH
jgi:hypothetical protein